MLGSADPVLSGHVWQEYAGTVWLPMNCAWGAKLYRLLSHGRYCREFTPSRVVDTICCPLCAYVTSSVLTTAPAGYATRILLILLPKDVVMLVKFAPKRWISKPDNAQPLAVTNARAAVPPVQLSPCTLWSMCALLVSPQLVTNTLYCHVTRINNSTQKNEIENRKLEK